MNNGITSTDINVAIRVLNEAFAADPATIHALIVNRIPCNQAMVEHPTIQCDPIVVLNDERRYSVGLLGVINGIVEPMTGRRVASKWSEPNEEGRSTLLGFQVYEPQ